MNSKWIAPVVVLVGCIVLVAGCGGEYTLGQGTITVDGLSSEQLVLCGTGGSSLFVTGSGFLSEHGSQVTVRYTALAGTPFQGGTSATEDVVAVALTDMLVEAPLPAVTGATEFTITVILPGRNEGISPPETVQLGGQLVGPFANFDYREVIGNVTRIEAAPGVLENDEHSSCASDEEERPDKPVSAGSTYNHNLAVIAPPASSTNPNDASPGTLAATQQGGTVQIEADGSYVYEPPLGYEGNDQFTYWIEEPGRPDPQAATVLLVVRHVVWFVRDTAAPGGTGRFSDPFISLDEFNAVQNAPASPPFRSTPLPIPPNPDDQPQEGDCIYVYDNVATTQYDGGIRLRDGQELIGQGVDLVLDPGGGPILIETASSAPNPNPVLTNSASAFGNVGGGYPVVTLANGNVVRGIDIDEPEGGQPPIGNGIFGIGVSGSFTDPDPDPRDKAATVVDAVTIRNTGDSSILLLDDPQGQALSGAFSIGDGALGQTSPDARVTIVGTQYHGIQIRDQESTSYAKPAPPTALAGGLTVEVTRVDIDDTMGDGIFCANANLRTENCIFGDVPANGPDIGQSAITYLNSSGGGTCDFTGVNDTMFDIGFRGYDIQTFASRTTVNLVGSFVLPCGGECFYAEAFSSDSTTPLIVANDGFHYQRTTSGPSFYMAGNAPDACYLTSMNAAGFAGQIVPTNAAGGMEFWGVTFDADGDASNGEQNVGAGDILVSSGNNAFNIIGDGIAFRGSPFATSGSGPIGSITFSDVAITHSGGSGLYAEAPPAGRSFVFDCAAHDALPGSIVSNGGGIAFTCFN